MRTVLPQGTVLLALVSACATEQTDPKAQCDPSIVACGQGPSSGGAPPSGGSASQGGSGGSGGAPVGNCPPKPNWTATASQFSNTCDPDPTYGLCNPPTYAIDANASSRFSTGKPQAGDKGSRSTSAKRSR